MRHYPYRRRRYLYGSYKELTPTQKFTVLIPFIIVGAMLFFSLPWLVPIIVIVVAACSMSPIGLIGLGLMVFFIGACVKAIYNTFFA